MKLKPEIKQFIKDNLHLIDTDDWNTFWGLVDNDQGVIFEDMQDVKDVTEFLLDCGCNPLKSCKTVPEGFLCCSDRSTISIPEGVLNISFGAFCGMENLTHVVIPHTVELIGNRAFGECVNLEEVTILNPNVMLGRSVFSKCSKLMLLKYNGTKKQFDSCFDDVAPLNEGCLVLTTEGPIQL